jgi:hypothetical protein
MRVPTIKRLATRGVASERKLLEFVGSPVDRRHRSSRLLHCLPRHVPNRVRPLRTHPPPTGRHRELPALVSLRDAPGCRPRRTRTSRTRPLHRLSPWSPTRQARSRPRPDGRVPASSRPARHDHAQSRRGVRLRFRAPAAGAVKLTANGRRTVLNAWQRSRDRASPHSYFGREVPAALLPLIQARLLARHLRGDLDQYLPWTVT